jgi:transposase
MKRPTRAQLERLEKSELIDLIFALMDEIDVLKGEVARLGSEIEALKQPMPPATSKNSSWPPSRDFKRDRPEGEGDASKKRGARDGHGLMRRELVDTPDTVIECWLARCGCGADVSGVLPSAVIRRQITELPHIKPVVIGTRQAVAMCPCCGKRVVGALPEGLEAERAFGPRLQATTTYLQHQKHMSYERTQQAVHDLFGVTLSQGGLACMSERAGEAAGEQAHAIQQAIQASPVIGSDETSARVDGRNWWEWVFVGANSVLHVIQPSRGEDVIAQVMGSARARAWLSDCWAPQLRAPTDKRQLCLAHQIRNLQGLIERAPRLRWARQMQALLREAIHLAKRRDQMRPRGFQRRVTQIEHQLTRLIDRPVAHPAAQALVKRYRKHRDHLLVFLRDPTVPYHNNDAERALRGSVVHRKVIGGFRAEWGAKAYAAIASVIDTAKRRGLPVFHALLGLFGPPVLPFVLAQSCE